MKKTGKWLAGIILVLFLVYFLGPRPPKPHFNENEITLPHSLTELEESVNQSEKLVKGLKPDNEARIIWADSTKQKTKIAFLYLHGFSASQAEGDPVHKDIAKKYSANLYLARLSQHGIDRGDSTLINLNAGDYEESAERALAIAEKLGDQVIIIGTSTGGLLSIYLASHHPELKAIVLYSPCVKLYDGTSVLLNKPWGLQIARLATGGPVMRYAPEGDAHAKYWQLNYRLEGVVALQNLIANTMKPSVFSQVKCPVFMAYYYKDEKEQDNTVSIPAMLKMYDELGTPLEMKEKKAIPDAGAHVIASSIRSKDWQMVEIETEKFLTDIVKL